MRAVGLTDLDLAARAVMRVAGPRQQQFASGLIEDAHASDLWRKRFGVAHPSGGTGSLHAQAQLYDVAPVVGASSAYVDAMSIVLNALQAWRKDGRRMGHQNS